jgi:hypothetical protein
MWVVRRSLENILAQPDTDVGYFCHSLSVHYLPLCRFRHFHHRRAALS